MPLLKHVLYLALFLVMATSCVKIPQESIDLSKRMGQDLAKLHEAHRNTVLLNYSKIKEDINSFIDDTYAPFIIHYVLKDELARNEKGEPSIFGVLLKAAENNDKASTSVALTEVTNFQEAARQQIASERKELLDPVKVQEAEIVRKVDASYNAVITANATITAYLESVKSVRKAQSEALSTVGLDNLDNELTDKLIQLSGEINGYVEQGKKIDVQSDDALKKLQEISNKIKDSIKN